jgi:UDP:flavonoid glycosyltransferase YjiC (YdhE family)
MGKKRFLFTSIPGFGHFHPIVPLAKALKAAGHDVAVATAPAFCDAVSAAGLEPIPAGLDWDESRLLETVPELREVPRERQGEWMMRRLFLDRGPRAIVPALLDIAPAWRPHVVLPGTYEFGGALAAEKLGLPYASCSISFRWNAWVLKHSAGPALARLRREFGLPPDPGFKAFGRHLDLCFVPPAWTLTEALMRPALTRLVRRLAIRSDLSLGQRMLAVRALVLQRLLALAEAGGQAQPGAAATSFIGRRRAEGAAPPAWLAELPHARTVYVSLGTVFPVQYPEVFDAVLAGLREEAVNLVLTVGKDLDPARFGAQPPNVRIERLLPPEQLEALLPHVDLCISHSGYGTVMDALALGVPLVLLPLAADQPVIAQTCFLSGVAPDLPAEAWRMGAKGLPIVRPDRLTPAVVRGAALKALEDPRYRAAARAVQAQLAALPDLETAVDRLAALAAKTEEPRP